MSDDDEPTNVFQFPGTKPVEQGTDDKSQLDIPPGAFIDKYGPSLWKPIGGMDNATLELMLYEFRQHKAIADVLITLMENELSYRAKTGREI